jgi:hypothetical protein
MRGTDRTNEIANNGSGIVARLGIGRPLLVGGLDGASRRLMRSVGGVETLQTERQVLATAHTTFP